MLFRSLRPCSSPSRKLTRSFRCRQVAQITSCAKQKRTKAAPAAAKTTDARREPNAKAAERHTPLTAVREPSFADYLPLVAVSLLWGSYTPALRYLYTMDSLLTPQTLTAYRTVISAIALLAASAASVTYSKYRQHQELQQQSKAEYETQQQLEFTRHRHISTAWYDKLRRRLPDWMSSTSSYRSDVSHSNNNSSSSSSQSQGSTATAAAVLAAGLELGIWNFLGTSSQAVGLELSTATKAAFLTQTTAVFTPCLAVLFGQAVAPVHWVACIVAVLGSCCIALDSIVDLSADLAPPAAAAVEAAADPTTAVLAAEQSSSSSSSSGVRYNMVSAPDLQHSVQQQAPEPAAASTVMDRNTARYTVGLDISQTSSSSSSNSSTTVLTSLLQSSKANSSSSSVPVAIGVAVPAAPCSAPCIHPQGVDPAVEWAPLEQPTAAAAAAGVVQNSSRLVLVADAGEVPLYSSSSSSNCDSCLQSPQQELAAEIASPLRLSASSSSSGAGQQTAVSAAAAAVNADSDSLDSSSSSFSGELYILLACCCYAVSTVRLSMLAPGLNPVHLATSKTLALAAASLCWLLAFPEGNVTTQPAAAAAATVSDVTELTGSESLRAAIAAAVQSAAEAWQLPETFRHGRGLMLLIYSALGPGALAAVMQVQGQSTVSAAQAQVFYSLTPVWAALMAFLLLQGEDMGPLAWIGGGVIVAASIGAAVRGGSSSSSSGGGGGGGARPGD